MTKTFQVTFTKRDGSPDFRRMLAKSPADVRQLLSNQDWFDGCKIVAITKQASDADLSAKFGARYGLAS
jgi:hypothetical protein